MTYKKIIYLLMAAASLVSLNLYFFEIESILYKNSLLNLFLLFPMVLLTLKSAEVTDRSLHKKALFAAFVLTFAFVIGKQLYETNDLFELFSSPGKYLYFLFTFTGLLFFLYSAVKLGLHFLCSYQVKSPLKNDWLYFGSKKRSLFLTWGIIFVCWIPCYLAYYPGIFSYDIDRQMDQIMGLVPFDQFQTTAHTFFYLICYKLGKLFGSPAAGLFIYSMLQMLILSFSFAVSVYYMAKINVHYRIRIFSIAYFSLNPLISIYSFITTKDILFTAFFVLLTVLLFDLVRDTERFFDSSLKLLALVINLVLCCLFRNNSVYAFLLFFIVLLLMKKQYAVKSGAVLAGFLAGYLLIVGTIFPHMGVKGGLTAEALSVPIQQMAQVYKSHKNELSRQEKKAIKELFSNSNIAKNYNPRIADPVKCHFDETVFKANKESYFKLWLTLFNRYPADYLNSFLSLNIGYWYPDSNYRESNANRMYLETFIRDIDGYPLIRQSKLPSLLKFYEDFAAEKHINKIPLVSLFFSISFPIWFLFLCMMLCIAKKGFCSLLIFLPSVFLWLTFMAGPVSNLRYVFPIMALYPILLAAALHAKNEKTACEP